MKVSDFLKKNKIKKINIYYILSIVVTIFVFLIFSFFIFKNNKNILLFKDIVSFKDKILSRKVVLEISDEVFMENYNSLDNDLKELKELLDLNILHNELDLINTTVISKNRNYYFNSITLDKGKNDGVVENLAVIDSLGMIGIIKKASDNFSEVNLFNSRKMSVKIPVNIGSEFGIIDKYDDKENMLIVIGVKNIDNVHIDDKVVTSSLSMNYPEGILIGNVNNIKKDNFGIKKFIYIKLASDIEKVKYAVVVKK